MRLRDRRQNRWQRIKAHGVKALGLIAVAVSLTCLGLLLADVFKTGWASLTLDFIQNFPSRFPAQAGIYSALIGTVWVIGLTALISVPVGVMSAVYLEEFAPTNRFTRIIRLNITNLSGVPSVVYGMLGLAFFVRALQLGRSVVAGALTMSLLILPTIIVATSEALKAVPNSIRFGAYGVGATRRQVVWHHVLPEAFPGIITAVILAISRALGESAPLILIGALSFVAFTPQTPMDSFTVLSIQIFNWASRPQLAFHEIAASGIIVLLAIILTMNAVAIILRTRMSRKKK